MNRPKELNTESLDSLKEHLEYSQARKKMLYKVGWFIAALLFMQLYLKMNMNPEHAQYTIITMVQKFLLPIMVVVYVVIYGITALYALSVKKMIEEFS